MGAQAEVEPMLDYGVFLLAGMPKEGQSLNEVKALMLGEIEKLKRGAFDDDLITAAVNNMKLDELQGLDRNSARVSKMLDAFINGIAWEQEVGQLDRLSQITKQDIVNFATRFFGEGYVTVYKRQGADTSQKKIEKPSITPIPTNRDLVSPFVKEVQESKVDPIQPVFLDFEKDLSRFETAKGLPVIYKQNKENDLFNLVFRYEFGQEDDNRYDVAAGYIDFLGTDKLSAAQLKQQFYKLACNYSLSVQGDVIQIGLSGLGENMPQALALLEDLLRHAKADRDAYEQYVALTLKNRQDVKTDQRTCFSMLNYYGMYGPHNVMRDNMTEQQLRETDPQALLDLLAGIAQFEHTVLYYGPLSEKELDKSMTELHVTKQPLKAVPEGTPYRLLTATQPEVFIAPYDAKNIYMRMYFNEGRQTSPDEHATIDLFNEYYGGGMNGIVFQELREARGLAYSAAAYYLTPSKQGEPENFFTYIITQNDKMMDCVRQFREILDKMPQSEAAFQIAKDALTKQLASQRTTKFNVILAYIAARRMGYDYDVNKKIYDDLQGLTLQDIANFEQQHMAGKTGRYLILGDEKELDIAALEKIAPIHRLSLEEIFGY